MPSIPLIGGPMDGGFWRKDPLPEIHFPTLGPNAGLFSSYSSAPLPGCGRIRHHTYRLSPCGRRYLHTSLVDQN